MSRLFSSQAIWLLVRLAGAAAGFAFQFALARMMTPADLGLFFSASSLAAVLGIVSTQGYTGVAARFISRYTERERLVWLADFLTSSQRAMALCAIALGSSIVAAAVFLPGFEQTHGLAFVYAGLSVPALAALTAFAAFGVAQRKFVSALLPELFLRSTTLAGFAGVALCLGWKLDAADAMLGFMIVTVAIAALQACLIRPSISRSVKHTRLSRQWRREAWTLLAVMLFTLLFGDLAIISATPFLKSSDVAAFGLAIKIAMIVGFGVQIAHQVLQPDLSDLYATRRKHDLTRVLLKGAAFPVAFTGTAMLVTMLCGSWVLRLYGPQFVYAAGPLLLLVACQFVRALAGPSQSVLILEGQQHTNLAVCCCAVFVLIAGNFILAGRYGLWGATSAASAAYLFWVVGGAVVLRARGYVATDACSLILALAEPSRATRFTK